jgi:hypothetical protein
VQRKKLKWELGDMMDEGIMKQVDEAIRETRTRMMNEVSEELVKDEDLDHLDREWECERRGLLACEIAEREYSEDERVYEAEVAEEVERDSQRKTLREDAASAAIKGHTVIPASDANEEAETKRKSRKAAAAAAKRAKYAAIADQAVVALRKLAVEKAVKKKTEKAAKKKAAETKAGDNARRSL